MIATCAWSYSLLLLVLLFCECNGFSPSSSSTSSSRVKLWQRRTRRRALVVLQDRKKGVYTRPSAAIEKGSGFFVPGLEGPRVRLFFGLAVLILTVVNYYLSSSSSPSTFAETVAVVYALLLLAQAAIEFGKESKGYVISLEDDDKKKKIDSETQGLMMQQRWAKPNLPSLQEDMDMDMNDGGHEDFREKVEWSAASFVALTPANSMMLIEKDQILYRLGKNGTASTEQERDGCLAALETLSKAKTGRVLIPPTHPAATKLFTPRDDTRTIVLQSIIPNKSCWVMSSDQLLAAFTDQDLKWLGQVGNYLTLL